jgi:hypothetical protein
METLIRENLSNLCRKAIVHKSLIDELYSKHVITLELTQQLVGKTTLFFAKF